MSDFTFVKQQSVHGPEQEVVSLSFLEDAFRRLRKNKAALFAFALVIIVVLLALFAPLIAPYNPNKQEVEYGNLPPKIPGLNINGFNGKSQNKNGEWVDIYLEKGVPEGVYHYLGTDTFGRDLFSRILYGLRVSLLIAFVAAILDLTIGIVYGMVSGLKGGKVDLLMQRFLELISGIPTLVIVIMMMMILPSGIISIITALVISSWFGMARTVRAETLQIKNLEYVSAAKALGASDWQLAIHHVLPNIGGIVVVRAMFSIPSAIFLEAFLSFIGIGMKPPNASLGVLLSEGNKVFRIYPYQMLAPTVVMVILMLGLNLLADGLRDVLDPHMKDY